MVIRVVKSSEVSLRRLFILPLFKHSGKKVHKSFEQIKLGAPLFNFARGPVLTESSGSPNVSLKMRKVLTKDHVDLSHF